MMNPASPNPIRKGLGPDVLAVLGFLGLLFVFYPELFMARAASLMGDHWEQHHPWAFLMAKSLKQGILPFWTPLIQCGFPIAAESQMGLFYLPNIAFYLLLPFKWAYSYMNVFHFFVSGVGTYFYARKIGLSPAAAFTAGIVFLFGAGYGGAYYNITSLKTLAWFPWILWSFESMNASFRKRYLFLAGFLMSLSILAGYLQIAALMLFICSIYVTLRLFVYPSLNQPWRERLKSGGAMLAAGAMAVVFSLPQLYLTFELSQFSNRINLVESYAYVGSLSPAALLTVVFPNLQGLFRGTCIYSGIFALLFVTAAFFIKSKELRRMSWVWVLLGIVALLLALGRWSPLYVALVKLTQFYSFRVPAKFLIFICYAVAMLAGLGVHSILEDMKTDGRARKIFMRCYGGVMLAVLFAWGMGYAFVTVGSSWISGFGKWIVQNFIYGQPGHPRSLDSYLETVETLISRIQQTLSFSDPWLIWAVVLILLSFIWAIFFKRGIRLAWLMAIAMGILLVDLYVFAGADIKKDFGAYTAMPKMDPVIQILIREKEAGKVERVFGFRKESESLSLIPSVNMLYGIEDIGGYSPLIMGRYFETIGQFGNVNDSNQMLTAEPSFALDRLPLLSAMGVSHLLSSVELSSVDLRLLVQDPVSRTYLYQNLLEHSPGYFVSSPVQFADWSSIKEMLMAPGFDPRQILLLEHSYKPVLTGIQLLEGSKAIRMIRVERAPARERWILETTGPGFFVLANTFYPGWRAELNGKEVSVLRAYGIFQAIYVPGPGAHEIELSYSPFHAGALVP